jgi:phage replication O-like protein O
MANPQVEQGHIRIANDLWEALCRADLSGLEYGVLLAIIRETWGWRKKQRALSFDILGKLTGINSRGYLSHITDNLVVKGFIKKKSQWGKPSLYSVSKDFDEWSYRKTVQKNCSTLENPDNNNLSTNCSEKSEYSENSEYFEESEQGVQKNCSTSTTKNRSTSTTKNRNHVQPCTTILQPLLQQGSGSGALKIFSEEISDPNSTIEKAIENAVRHHGEDIVAGAIYEASEAGAEGWGLVAKILRDRKRDGTLDELLDYLPDNNPKGDPNLGCPTKLSPDLEFYNRSKELQLTGLSMQEAMKQAHIEVYGFERKSS